MSATTHIIHKVSVEVQTASAETSSFKEEMDRLIKEAILKSIESYLVEHEKEYEERSVQVEKLSLDLQLDSLAHNHLDISTQVHQQMDVLFSQARITEKDSDVISEKALEVEFFNDTESNDSGIVYLQSLEKVSKTVLHFLRYGTAPWWIPDSVRMSSIVNDEKLIELIYKEQSFISALKRELNTRTSKLRLIQQFSDSTLVHVFAAISDKRTKSEEQKIQFFFEKSMLFIQELSQSQRAAFWLVVSEFATQQIQPGFIPKLFTTVSRVFENHTISSQEISTDAQSSAYIQMASIVSGICTFESIQEVTAEEYTKNVVTPALEAASFKLPLTAEEQKRTAHSDEKSPADQVTEVGVSKSQEDDTKLSDAEQLSPTDEMHDAETNEVRQDLNKSSKSDDTSLTTPVDKAEITKKIEEEPSSKKPKAKTESEDGKADITKGQEVDEHTDRSEELKESLSDKSATKLKVADQKNEINNSSSESDFDNSTESKKSAPDSNLSEESINSAEENAKVNTENVEAEENRHVSSDKNQSHGTEEEQAKKTNGKSSTGKEDDRAPEEGSNDVQNADAQAVYNEINELLNNMDQVVSEPFKENFIAENAGVILLHPFLKAFFTKLELLDDEGGLKDPEFAAHLLHYASTGEEMEYEYSMTFEKFLCGISPDYVIQRKIDLSDEVKENVNELLSAVLQHWSALKTNSIALLRNEFLRRQAKVVIDDSNPRVIFERKTIDIMLDRLPWNMSIIKLPWRTELLYVEW